MAELGADGDSDDLSSDVETESDESGQIIWDLGYIYLVDTISYI